MKAWRVFPFSWGQFTTSWKQSLLSVLRCLRWVPRPFVGLSSPQDWNQPHYFPLSLAHPPTPIFRPASFIFFFLLAPEIHYHPFPFSRDDLKSHQHQNYPLPKCLLSDSLHAVLGWAKLQISSRSKFHAPWLSCPSMNTNSDGMVRTLGQLMNTSFFSLSFALFLFFL